MVNGEPITNYDIEQRTKLNFLTTHKQMPRQEVINELIDEKVKIKEGKRFGVDPGVERHRPILRAAWAQRMRIIVGPADQDRWRARASGRRR